MEAQKKQKGKLVPKLRFKGFDGDWFVNSSKIKIVAGNAYKLSEYSEKGLPLIQGFNIMPGVLDMKDEKKISLKEEQSHVFLIKGDVLMGLNRPITNGELKVCRYDLENTGVLYQRAGKIEVDQNMLHIDMFYQFLRSPKFLKSLSLELVGSDQPYLKSNLFEVVKLNIPTLPEQQKISSFLSSVDEKLSQLTRKKELLAQYKKGVMQQLFSGTLRFKDENGKEFKKWEVKRLGDIGKIISGLTYSPNDINENGILVLRSSNVQDRRLTYADNVFVNVSKGDFNPVEENDILICVRNGSKNLIGKNALIDKSSAGVAFGAFMTVFRSKSNSYLFHYFDTDMYKNEVHKNLGATINSINGSDLKKFKIPFPCLQEQQKIATFLSSIDDKITAISAQISQTQSFKKGLLQQMFV